MKKLAARDFEDLLQVRLNKNGLYRWLILAISVCHPRIRGPPSFPS